MASVTLYELDDITGGSIAGESRLSKLTRKELEWEIVSNNSKVVDDLELRSTDGLLPYVLTILENLGAPTPTTQEVELAFLRYGKRGYPRGASAVYIPENIPVEQLPAHFPTLQRLRELSDHYFFKPVGMYNAQIGDVVQFSLCKDCDERTDNERTEDKRTDYIIIFVRCHYDLKQRKNII